jgi:hypothetical protein
MQLPKDIKSRNETVKLKLGESQTRVASDSKVLSQMAKLIGSLVKKLFF